MERLRPAVRKAWVGLSKEYRRAHLLQRREDVRKVVAAMNLRNADWPK